MPSGLVVNLDSIRRIEPLDDSAKAAKMVYFAEDEKTTLTDEDAMALEKRLGLRGMGSNARVAAFWIVLLTAVFLVYLAIRTHP